MAGPQFDSNAWYSLQNMGNNAYLGCNSISICGADGSDLSTFERFQINAAGGSSPYYIRPESRNVDDDGQPFCINLSSGQPSLALCNGDSATWGTGYWNGADAGDGLFFFDTQRGESQRLFLSDNGTWSLLDYNNEAPGDQDLMKWSTSSLAAINNQSYSTVPAAIASSGTLVTTATTSAANATTMTTTTTSGSTSVSMSSTQSISSLTATLTANTTDGPSTTTVVQTPTVTVPVNHSTSHVSTTPTASPALVNGAGKAVSNAYTVAALAVMVAMPQLVRLMS